MNRLIFTAFFLLVSIHGTFAQDNGSVKYDDLYSPKVTSISEGKGQLERYHGSLMFVETNRFLSANDVTNAFWKKYYGAKRLQSWGQYLWGLGLSYMATDMIFDLVYRNDRNLLKDPYFSAAYPSRRLNLEGDPDALAPIPGLAVYPEPAAEGSSILRHMLDGN